MGEALGDVLKESIGGGKRYRLIAIHKIAAAPNDLYTSDREDSSCFSVASYSSTWIWGNWAHLIQAWATLWLLSNKMATQLLLVTAGTCQ